MVSIKVALLALVVMLAGASVAGVAPTLADLEKEVLEAYQTRSGERLAGCQVFTLITGDIPLGRGLFDPTEPRADLYGIDAAFLEQYEVAAVTSLSPAEMEKSGARITERYPGCIRVDFRARPEAKGEVKITAFARLYPYRKAAEGFVLAQQ